MVQLKFRTHDCAHAAQTFSHLADGDKTWDFLRLYSNSIQSIPVAYRNSLCHSLSRWLRLSGLRPARKISQRCSIAAPELNFTCLFYFLQCLGTHPRGIIPEFASVDFSFLPIKKRHDRNSLCQCPAGNSIWNPLLTFWVQDEKIFSLTPLVRMFWPRSVHSSSAHSTFV